MILAWLFYLMVSNKWR